MAFPISVLDPKSQTYHAVTPLRTQLSGLVVAVTNQAIKDTVNLETHVEPAVVDADYLNEKAVDTLIAEIVAMDALNTDPANIPLDPQTLTADHRLLLQKLVTTANLGRAYTIAPKSFTVSI